MGKFLDLHNESSIITSEIDSFMQMKGFRVDTSAYGGAENGWCNGYYDKTRSFFYRVHITKERVQVHYEFECGGVISETEYKIHPNNIETVNEFIQFLDEVYENMNI